MSHFYGTLQGNRGEATRCGSRASGMETCAAGWGGAIHVHLYHKDGEDRFTVTLIPWRGRGDYRTLARGIVGTREGIEIYNIYNGGLRERFEAGARRGCGEG